MLINDPSNTKFTAAQKQAEIQKAQEVFVLDTACLKDTTSFTLVAGTAEYSLPTDILDVIRVSHAALKLERVSQFEMDVLVDSDWTDDTGTPVKYYIDLDPNNKKIHFYPIPNATAVSAAATAIMEYLKQPPALSSDSDVPLDSHTLLGVYHDAISYKAASNLLNIRPDQASLFMVGQYDKKYQELVEACVNRFKGMGAPKPLNIYRGKTVSNIDR